MNRNKHDLCHFFDFHGPLYAYLGHFLDEKVLCQGHNDMSGQDDAAAMDETVQELGAGRAPNQINQSPEGA